MDSHECSSLSKHKEFTVLWLLADSHKFFWQRHAAKVTHTTYKVKYTSIITLREKIKQSVAEAADKIQIHINLTLQPCLVRNWYMHQKTSQKAFYNSPSQPEVPLSQKYLQRAVFSLSCLPSQHAKEPAKSCSGYGSAELPVLFVSAKQQTGRLQGFSPTKEKKRRYLRVQILHGRGRKKAGRQKNWSVVKRQQRENGIKRQ